MTNMPYPRTERDSLPLLPPHLTGLRTWFLLSLPLKLNGNLITIKLPLYLQPLQDTTLPQAVLGSILQ